jgi:hypothetical protein
MLLPIIGLFAAELVLQALPIEAAVRSATASFTATGPLAARVLDNAAWLPPPAPLPVTETRIAGPVIGLVVALGIAAIQLGRHHFPRGLVRIAGLSLRWMFAGLDRLHNGILSDHVAWLLLALLVVGGIIAIG